MHRGMSGAGRGNHDARATPTVKSTASLHCVSYDCTPPTQRRTWYYNGQHHLLNYPPHQAQGCTEVLHGVEGDNGPNDCGIMSFICDHPVMFSNLQTTEKLIHDSLPFVAD